jgi:hypothetical protein
VARPRSNNGSVGPLSKLAPQQPGPKVNNYLTIDVSGVTPAAATAAISITQGGQTNREAQLANRVPRQKVLNIKVKENQFVPMTVTNKDHRDSFKFSNTHIMQKMLTGATAVNQSQSNGSISTRNLSLA